MALQARLFRVPATYVRVGLEGPDNGYWRVAVFEHQRPDAERLYPELVASYDDLTLGEALDVAGAVLDGYAWLEEGLSSSQ